MRKGTYVRLVKVGAMPNGIPSCPAALYAPGAWNDGILSLPFHYWMEGYLLCDLIRRNRILLHRFVRNGVVARGLFASTVILSIRGSEVGTANSVYRVMKVPPLEAGEKVGS